MSKNPFPDTLNICLMSYKFPILGRATDHGFLWPIAKGLAAKGHKVTVIAAKGNIGKSDSFRDGVQTYFLLDSPEYTGRKSFSELAKQKFEQLHNAQRFHILHCIDSSCLKIAQERDRYEIAVAYDADATQMSQIVSILGMGQETVGGILSTAIAIVYKFLSTFYGGDNQLLKTAHGVFVSNPQQRMLLERYYLFPDYHMYTVPYGVEIGNLAPRTESKDLRLNLNIPLSAQVAVTTSDMSETNEMYHLLRAFEKVAIKKPNAYLLIIGNGPKWKEIEFEILSAALGKRALMVGAVKEQDITDYISIADVFINLSSRTTGFDPTIIEAMAQKKVVIGSEVSAIANIIEDTVDGFLLRPADIPSLSKLLIEIFSNQIEKAPIGERARAKVINLFDSKKMVDATLDAYFKILMNSGYFLKRRNHHDAIGKEISP
jgi:glycosyltransferase involved in cell wall biosynthesis